MTIRDLIAQSFTTIGSCLIALGINGLIVGCATSHFPQRPTPRIALELHEELTSEAYIRGLDQALSACDDPEEAKHLEELINSRASRGAPTDNHTAD